MDKKMGIRGKVVPSQERMRGVRSQGALKSKVRILYVFGLQLLMELLD